MKIFNILIIIINIESSENITENAYLEKNLPVLLQKIKDNLTKTSAVLPVEILKKKVTEIRNCSQKYLVKETDKVKSLRAIENELVNKLNYTKAIIEEHVFEDTMEEDDVQKLSDDMIKELLVLLDIFKKVFNEKSVEPEGIKNFRTNFIKQHEDLIAFLKNSSSEDFVFSEDQDFEEEVKKRLISLEKVMTSLNREVLVNSEVTVFLKELDEKLDRLIKIFKENRNGDHQDNSNITEYGFNVREELTSLCDFLLRNLNVDLKEQSESIKIQPDLYEKLASLVNFLTDPRLYKSADLTEKGFNQTPLGENSGVDSVIMQTLPENSQTPLVINEHTAIQNTHIDHKTSSINPPKNIVLTESNGPINEFSSYNQQNNERNIQEPLSTIKIEDSTEGSDLQNSPITNHNDTNPNSLNPLQKRPIASPVLEPEDQLGLNTSEELLPENLSIVDKDTKDELEPEKNIQDKNMTTSIKSLQEEDPKVSSLNTKVETMLESQQNVNSNDAIQGDDPAISEALNLSNDEQLVLKNEDSILSNTNKDQNKENPSQISKTNVKKELEKTSVDSLHNNGLAIVKDELKNNKAPEVEKKSEKIVEDVDIPEKNKTEPKITEDLKTDLPKKNYDNLKKFANNHSKKKNLLKGVQQKTVSNNDSKTLHTKKDKQLEDSSPIEVLNNHKKSIVEDAHDNSSILRVNGNVSAGKKIKDDGKPLNSVQKNDFMSFKVKPLLNGIIPAITLNFTISRRVL